MVELSEAGTVETALRPCARTPWPPLPAIPTRRAATAAASSTWRCRPQGPARIRVWQRHDGDLVARIAAPEATTALDALRFVLATDIDHTPVSARGRPRLAAARSVRRRAGLRPARLGSVTHALVRAVCGQLITAREAMQIERRLLARICAPAGELRLPPEASDIARLSAAAGRAGGALAAAGGGARPGRAHARPGAPARRARPVGRRPAVRRAGARAVVGRRDRRQGARLLRARPRGRSGPDQAVLGGSRPAGGRRRHRRLLAATASGPASPAPICCRTHSRTPAPAAASASAREG